MDNKNNAFDEELRDPVSGNEIEADELAVYAAGLTHPEDLELEAILAEDWDSVPDQDLPEMTPEEALNQFLYGDDDTELPAEENLEDAPTQVISMAAAEEAQEDDAPAFEEEEEDAEMEDDFQEDEEEALEEAYNTSRRCNRRKGRNCQTSRSNRRMPCKESIYFSR